MVHCDWLLGHDNATLGGWVWDMVILHWAWVWGMVMLLWGLAVGHGKAALGLNMRLGNAAFKVGYEAW